MPVRTIRSGWYRPITNSEFSAEGVMGHRGVIYLLKDVPGHVAAANDRVKEDVFYARAARRGWVRFVVIDFEPGGVEFFVNGMGETELLKTARYLERKYGPPEHVAIDLTSFQRERHSRRQFLASASFLLSGRALKLWIEGRAHLEDLA